jgi:hypothetical protein
MRRREGTVGSLALSLELRLGVGDGTTRLALCLIRRRTAQSLTSAATAVSAAGKTLEASYQQAFAGVKC